MVISANSSETFSWFESQWQQWLHLVQSSQVPNAMLLAGAAGIGKFSMASRFAHLLLCQQCTPQDACGVCKNCQLLAADSHPDYLYVKPEDKSRSVKIDQVRQLSEFVQSKPQISQRRVAILQPAEAMNVYSANAILKTLEEPPGSAVIILITQQPSLLLPTIRSRCQITKLPVPEFNEARQWLLRQTGLPEDESTELLISAGGQPMTALARYTSKQGLNQQEVFAAWAAYLSGEQDAFSVAEMWTKLNTDWLLTWLGNVLRDSLRSKTDSSFGLSGSLATVAAKLSEEAIWCLYQELLAIRKSQHQQRNLNMQLVFEHWLLLNKRKY